MYFLTVFLVMLSALHIPTDIPTDPTDITNTDRVEVSRKLIYQAYLIRNQNLFKKTTLKLYQTLHINHLNNKILLVTTLIIPLYLSLIIVLDYLLKMLLNLYLSNTY